MARLCHDRRDRILGLVKDWIRWQDFVIEGGDKIMVKEWTRWQYFVMLDGIG